jgi:hypothetical protein
MNKDTSDHGLKHPLTGAGLVEFGVTANKNEFVLCLFLFDWGF